MFARIQLLLFIFCLYFTNVTYAQDNLNNIVMNIQNANTKELAKNFNKRLDITINQNENNYSIEQAEMVLRNFLNGLTEREMVVLQKGKSEDNTLFIIGTLKSKNSKYKTYILLKNTNKVSLIHDIRFEKE
jgi:hypothetical protein